MPSLRLIAFDLDGTLIDSVGDLRTAVNRTLERLAPGTAPLSLDRVRSFIGEGAGRLVARTLEAAGLKATHERALQLFLEEYAGCLLDATCAYPGVELGLQALAGRRLAVLTNKPGGFSRRILAGLALDGYFHTVVGGDEAPRKPDPTGLLQLMAAAGARPDETLFVGDSGVDADTAKAAGVAFVGVGYGLDPDALAARGARVVERFDQLPALVRAHETA